MDSSKADSRGGPNNSAGVFLLASSAVGVERLGLAISSLDKFLLIVPGLRLGLFLTGDGDSAMFPIDALSSSTVAALLKSFA